MSFRFELLVTDPTGARRGRIHTEHGIIETPCFMPVGTLGNIKTLGWRDVRELGAQMVLANTYHLYLRPGHELVGRLGGFHKFTGWDRPVLTDSGGYQVYSLASRRVIDEDGVEFRSHLDGSSHRFTPETVFEIQRSLGVDIAMVLDECCPYPVDREYARDSMERTHRWAERSRLLWKPGAVPGALYGILQGGMYEDLRTESGQVLVDLDFPGYAVGGLAVGEEPSLRNAMLDVSLATLPQDRPRYLMGVGYPQDLVGSVERGVDQFDCVLPTRNGRKGMLFTNRGPLVARAARNANDDGPLDPDCPCRVCASTSRAYLRHLFASKELVAQSLASYHNLFYY